MAWIVMYGLYNTIGVVGALITTKNILDNTTSIYDSLSKITTFEHIDVNFILEELDLDSDLRLIESLMEEIDKHENKTIIVKDVKDVKDVRDVKDDDLETKKNNDILILSTPKEKVEFTQKSEKIDGGESFIILEKTETKNDIQGVALYNIHEIQMKIKKVSDLIHKKMKKHGDKYFSKWRTLDVSSELHCLRKYKKIMTSRLTRLMDVLKIFRK